MSTADAGNEPSFQTALDEAVPSLRGTHPDTMGSDGGDLDALTVLLVSGVAEAARRDAARILAMLAEQFPGEPVAVVPVLVDGLDDMVVRKHALRALGYMSDADPAAVSDAVDSVVTALKTDDATVIRDAAWVVSNVALKAPDAVTSAVPAFVQLLSHDDEAVQRRAASTLAVAPESALPEIRTHPRLSSICSSRRASIGPSGEHSSPWHRSMATALSTAFFCTSTAADRRATNTSLGRSSGWQTTTQA